MRREQVERVVLVSSAVSFGLSGWLVAHGLTEWLLTHQHVIDTGGVVRHSHGFLGPATVVAVCLAAATLLSLFAVTSRGGQERELPPIRWCRDLRRSAALSSAAYVVAEAVEHRFDTAAQLPGPLVVLIGATVYLLVGIVTSLLWRGSTRAVRSLAARLSRPPQRSPLKAISIPASGEAPVLRRQRWALPIAGRAPPFLPA
ncbi:hypothetical protein ABGB12_34680 [Actinocorallia sp. B10E7]|uniref:hypothetical protein n=1 Tax=Actinocorallia sp. B10E7 TaxID=3153558 RepID=UPI00325DBC24